MGYLLEHRQPINGYVTTKSDMPSPGPMNCLTLMNPSLMHNEMPVGSILGRSCRGNHSYSKFMSAMALLSPEGSVWQCSSNEQGHISFVSRVTAAF